MLITKDEILAKLKELKPHYAQEGFEIVGLFGSYARGEADENSDIDILYDLEAQKFCALHPGFRGFGRLKELKDELKTIFSKNVDLATINSQSKTFKEFALKDAVYV